MLARTSHPEPTTPGSAPTASTLKANQQVLEQRPFNNREDFEYAHRGLIAQDPNLVITHPDGEEVWNMSGYAFIDSEGKGAPASVNPSLWRQAALNNIHGLFEVKEGVYQIRGYDLANMSIIEGGTGWILVDPLTARETASKAFLFAREHLGEKPVRAILFTHSHIDHFGGVQGVLQHLSDEEKINLRIIAPAGFEDEATRLPEEQRYAMPASGAGSLMRRGICFRKRMCISPAIIGHYGGRKTFRISSSSSAIPTVGWRSYSIRWSSPIPATGRPELCWPMFMTSLATRQSQAPGGTSISRAPMSCGMGLKELLFSDDISFEGSKLDLIGFFGMLDKPEGRFNIVTP